VVYLTDPFNLDRRLRSKRWTDGLGVVVLPNTHTYVYVYMSAYKLLVGTPQAKRPWIDLGVGGGRLFKWILDKWNVKVW
jgi:hypothetical protein